MLGSAGLDTLSILATLMVIALMASSEAPCSLMFGYSSSVNQRMALKNSLGDSDAVSNFMRVTTSDGSMFCAAK